jgi:5-methylcytosine-specific restriction protein A
MNQFDADLRQSERWEGWENNRSHKYAILERKTLYPVKQIVSLASGIPVSKFSGGIAAGQANKVARNAGFEVVVLHNRNPDWTRDELILALDLYLNHSRPLPGKSSKEVVELSNLLNRIGSKIHGEAGKEATYRNANGVYMKLMNFRRFDPDYTATGRKGLTAGNKDEEVVWMQFAGDTIKCHDVALAIIKNLDSEGADLSDHESDEGFFEDAAEGRLLTRLHMRRERNQALVQAKKRMVLKEGKGLACEICGFNFSKAYGDRGDGFIECHHTKPLETLLPGSRTHVRDLALVCSNCHRMIHRRRPWLTIEQLVQLLHDR